VLELYNEIYKKIIIVENYIRITRKMECNVADSISRLAELTRGHWTRLSSDRINHQPTSWLGYQTKETSGP